MKVVAKRVAVRHRSRSLTIVHLQVAFGTYVCIEVVQPHENETPLDLFVHFIVLKSRNIDCCCTNMAAS